MSFFGTATAASLKTSLSSCKWTRIIKARPFHTTEMPSDKVIIQTNQRARLILALIIAVLIQYLVLKKTG
jgi:hypothetical protein